MQKNAVPNAIAFAGAIIANGLANALPLNGFTTGELSDMYPNLFVPAGLTFSIWALIYLLLLGFVVNGFLKSMDENNDTYKRIGWLFVANCVFNAAWIFAWHYLQVELSLVIMAGILTTLILMYQRLKIGISMTPLREKWLVHTPISVYLGWISVASIANVTTLLVSYGITFGANDVIITQVMIAVAAILGVTMVLRRHDIPYALVIVWALFGIYIKRSKLPEAADEMIALTATTCGGIVVLAILWRMIKRRS